MIYVERDDSGTIVGIYANAQPGFAEEAVSENSEEIAEYINRISGDANGYAS